MQHRSPTQWMGEREEDLGRAGGRSPPRQDSVQLHLLDVWGHYLGQSQVKDSIFGFQFNYPLFFDLQPRPKREIITITDLHQ